MTKKLLINGQTHRKRGLALAIALVMALTAVFALPLTANAETVDVRMVDAGDIVYYGHYPKDDLGTVGAISAPDGLEGVDWVTSAAIDYPDNDLGVHYYAIKPIAWKVLSDAENKLFLLAQDALDAKPYHTDNISVTWETSTVRSWLNGYAASEADASVANPYSDSFINTAFTADEQGFIASTTVYNPNNPSQNTNGGATTTDNIFFLQLDDTIKSAYFGSAVPAYGSAYATRAAIATDYAKAHRAYNNMYGNVIWWLRSPGYNNSDYAAIVDSDGSVYDRGFNVYFASGAVRPALYLSNLESLIFTSAAAGGTSYSYNAYIKRTISFNSAGGSDMPELVVGSGQPIGNFGMLPTPTWAGHIFDGWYTEASGGTKITADTVVKADVTYHAHWTEVSNPPALYTLTVDSGTGSGSYPVGTTVGISANTAPSGKVFDKWISTGGGTFANENSASTTFTMPGNSATVTATYKTGGSDGNQGGSGNQDGDGKQGGGNSNEDPLINIGGAAGGTTVEKITDKAYTGKQITPSPVIKLNGKALAKGTDYTATYKNNIKIGKATVTLTGKGKYSGTKVIYFNIVPKKTSISKTMVGKNQIKITWKKVSAAQKITKYQVRYKVKGAKNWTKPKTVSAKSKSFTVKKLKTGKIYQIQVRSYKTVSKVKYYSAWSAVKTTKKIK